jgi:hypothetical protein
VLLTCQGGREFRLEGSGEVSSFARDLALDLGMEVVAPTDRAWIGDGEIRVSAEHPGLSRDLEPVVEGDQWSHVLGDGTAGDGLSISDLVEVAVSDADLVSVGDEGTSTPDQVTEPQPDVVDPGASVEILALEATGAGILEVFSRAENEYASYLQQSSVHGQEISPVDLAAQRIANEDRDSLNGLKRLSQQHAMKKAEPGSATGRAGRDAYIFAETNPELTIQLPAGRDWFSDSVRGTIIGKLTRLSPAAYPRMANSMLNMGQRLGATRREIELAIASGSPLEVDNLINKLKADPKNASNTKQLELERYEGKLKRVSFLLHAIEPARKPGIAISTALAATLLGLGKSELGDFIAGKHAPMAEKGAASYAQNPGPLPLSERNKGRFKTYVERATAKRYERVGRIVKDFIQGAHDAKAANQSYVSLRGYDLLPLAEVLAQWCDARTSGDGIVSAQVESDLLRELRDFLASYDNGTR